MGALMAMKAAIKNKDFCDYLILESPVLNFGESTISPRTFSIISMIAKFPGLLKCFGGIWVGNGKNLACTRDKTRNELWNLERDFTFFSYM